MQIERKPGQMPNTAEVAKLLSHGPEKCLGCKGCKGLCAALIDAMTVPEIVLDRS